MSALSFSVVSARAEPYAAAPALSLRVRIVESSGARIDTIGLRTQVQIEPHKRRYGSDESQRLVDLFGTQDRYGDTLKPLLWTHVSTMVLRFRGETEVDLAIPCSYDFEIAAHKYLAALQDGEIPLNLLFSGTVFVGTETGFATELLSWTCEARYRLPVAVWRETMDAFFPNSAWIRMHRDVFEEVDAFRRAHSLPTWDAALTRLCEAARAAR